MKAPKLLLELEELIAQLGFRIRKEKGNFRSNSCVLMSEKIIMLNKNHPPETQVRVLSRILAGLNLDGQFVKPAVRNELQKIWKDSPVKEQLNLGLETEGDE